MSKFVFRKPLLPFLIVIFAIIGIIGAESQNIQKKSGEQMFRVMTYNVENLFDTCHDAGFADEDFLPSSKYQWNTPRYWAKQQRLSRVIVAAGGVVPVDLVALCEVENDTVVNHLCRRTRLRRLGYDYVVTHSRDARGVDVALLYQPLRFHLLEARSYRVPFSVSYGRYTRDILHAAGCLQSGDTLDVFVCHWPSRRGGTKSSRDFRLTTARTLRQKVDSVAKQRSQASILIMGDFNDEYTDASIKEALDAHPFNSEKSIAQTASHEPLFVLTANLKAEPDIHGTYKYRGQWNQLDQIIVSKRLLLGTSRLYTTPHLCRIFAPSFLTEKDESNGGVKPFRTFLGPAYHGGFSDHFPVVLDFHMKK